MTIPASGRTIYRCFLHQLEMKGWDNSVVCPICLKEVETNHHLLIDCAFARQVTSLICNWLNIPTPPPDQQTDGRVATWFNKMTDAMQPTDRRKQCGYVLYTWWNIWKERNRRIFQGEEKEAFQVALLAKEEITTYEMAMCPQTMPFDPG